MIIQASSLKCRSCGKPAEVFWPCIDPDIRPNPYCRKCVAKREVDLYFELERVMKGGEEAMECKDCGKMVRGRPTPSGKCKECRGEESRPRKETKPRRR